MRAGPANAVHTVTAPEITARVAQPVGVAPAPIRIEGLTVPRGALPTLSRSIADSLIGRPHPYAPTSAAVIDPPRPSRHHRLETLHP